MGTAEINSGLADQMVKNAEAQLIHFRSASRVGYSDLGVNRKRMLQIRAAYAQAAISENGDAARFSAPRTQ